MFESLIDFINNVSLVWVILFMFLAALGLAVVFGKDYLIEKGYHEKVLDMVRQKSTQITDTIKTQVNQNKKPINPTKQGVIGKYLTKNIFSKDKKVIGLKGNLISDEIATEAEKEGLLAQLEENSSNWPINT